MIARGLREALESWGLHEDRLVCVTTDNAANNTLALQLNEWTRLQCFGHPVGVCKRLVSAFSNSWKRQRELAKVQAELGLPAHQLITDTPTRWSSLQLMINRVIEQEKALSQVLRADKKTRHLVLTWQDMDVLESLNKALSPLTEFTDALSGEHYTSVSYLKAVLHLFNTQVLKPQDDDTQLTTTIKEGILNYLKDKYDDQTTEELLDMASFVDPRFKTTYIKEEKVANMKTRVMSELENLVVEQTASAEAALLPSAGASKDDPEVCAKRQRKSLSSYFKKTTQCQTAPLSTRDSVEKELNQYLRTLEACPETNPLDWWKPHEAHFPLLAKLAKKYLCIPATSAPSERAFSTSGNTVTCQRSALKPERVHQLIQQDGANILKHCFAKLVFVCCNSFLECIVCLL
ncbi:cathepsin X [Sarotherodon galilaeus]